MTESLVRHRVDRCPGVLRPWPAADGALVRVRLIGGRITGVQLGALADLAAAYGDGRVHLTGRANLQLRGLPDAPVVAEAIEAAGLLPSRTHERVRNVLVSPLTGVTGVTGGRADLTPVAAELDRRLCAEPALAGLPGRFLFVLDDGRGDLVGRPGDLGLVALSSSVAQLRIGTGWGPVVPLVEAAAALVDLALRFQTVRGSGPTAPWHVTELPTPLAGPRAHDPRVPTATSPPPYGDRHREVRDGVLGPDELDALRPCPELRVTPWHGVVVAR